MTHSKSQCCGAYVGSAGRCSGCGNTCVEMFQSTATPPKIEEWKDNFNNLKSLGVVDGFLDYGDDDCPPEINWDRIEYFISQLLTQTRLSTIEEAKGCVPEGMDTITADCSDGYNSCRSEMLENLNKLK